MRLLARIARRTLQVHDTQIEEMGMRCLVIDDDPRDRELVERMVGKAGHQASTVADADAAVALAKNEAFDIALVDLGMPDTLRRLRSEFPDLRLLVVSGFDDRQHVLGAVGAGADGYVLKSEINDRLPLALSEVAAGGGPMSARIAHFVLEELRADNAEGQSAEPHDPRALSRREWDVLQGLSRGLTYAEIAGSLKISVNTVRHHIRNLYGKLEVSGKAEAVARALGNSAARPEDKN
jgi:DNA-binding NarL/FixJ family response regulator